MTSISPLCLSKDDPFLLLLIQLFTPYIHTSDKMDVKEVVLDFRLIKLLSPACASALPITILFVPFMFLYIYTYDCLPRRYLYLTYIIKYRTHTNRRILDEKGVFYSNFQREVLYQRGIQYLSIIRYSIPMTCVPIRQSAGSYSIFATSISSQIITLYAHDYIKIDANFDSILCTKIFRPVYYVSSTADVHNSQKYR